MANDETERSQRARIGGLARVALAESRSAVSAPARKAYRESFRQGHECGLCPRIDIDQELPEEEIQAKADILYRLHMTRISHHAKEKRRKAAEAVSAAIRAEAAVIAASGDAV